MPLFFDIGYRLVAIALCFSCGRMLWHGLMRRRVLFFNTDFWDWWTPARQVFYRDRAPIRYWIVIGGEAISTVLLFVAAIFGWISSSA